MRKKLRGFSTPVVVAGLLMVAFFVWILLQMAPHGPSEGALLARLGVGLAVALIGTALVLGLLRVFGGDPSDDDR